MLTGEGGRPRRVGGGGGVLCESRGTLPLSLNLPNILEAEVSGSHLSAECPLASTLTTGAAGRHVTRTMTTGRQTGGKRATKEGGRGRGGE